MENGFTYFLKEKKILKKPKQDVYFYLKNIAAWPRLLPHVKSIEIIQDDGESQEFNMEVFSETGELLKVRSIRKCFDDVGLILFFQPDPPHFLRNHAGGWIFDSLTPTKCRITTYHQWNLADKANRDMTPAKVKKLLKNHAKLALIAWQKVIEGS